MSKKDIAVSFHFTFLLFIITVLIISAAVIYPATDGRNKVYAGRNEIASLASSDSLITIRIIAGGDAMMHEPQINAGKNDSGVYDFNHYFDFISPLLKSADLRIVNFETTLCGGPYSGYPQFCAPDAYAFALKNAGFNFFITANNHSVDRNLKGINRTIYILDSIKIRHTGTFRNNKERDSLYPVLLNIKGITLALLNYTYGTNGIKIPSPAIVNLIDTAQISEDIEAARKLSPDFLIVTIHWGNEYEREPGYGQKAIANFLISKGVDVIIGSHPHVIQPVAFANDDLSDNSNLIIWSLGNLVSNQRRQYTNGGLLVQFDLIKNKYTSRKKIDNVGYYPVWVYKAENPVKYQILPASFYDVDSLFLSLPLEDRNTFSTFINDTRKHMKRDTVRVKEFQL